MHTVNSNASRIADLPKLAPVQSAQNELENSVARLTSLVADLELRLMPVMTPIPAEPAKTSGQVPHAVSMTVSQGIRESCLAVSVACDRLDMIRERLEI